MAAKLVIELLSAIPLAELAAKIVSSNKLVNFALAVNLPPFRGLLHTRNESTEFVKCQATWDPGSDFA
jgi:hypothetical protein